MNRTIIAFQPRPMQPPIPQRARPDRLRALPQFSAIVMWIASAVLQRRGQDVHVVDEASIPPALRDQVSEETVRALATLDPIAEGVARKRARDAAAEEIAKLLAAPEVDRRDPVFVQDRVDLLTDLVLGRYRAQLVYGQTGVPAVEVTN